MRLPATKWRLCGMLLLIILSGALPLHAQTLDVCNKGTVTVEVVVAMRAKDVLFRPYWVITGTPVAPRACERVYDEGRGEFPGNQYPAYIGFGFADSQGQWGAGTVKEMPKMGDSIWGLFSHPILKEGEKTLCVHRDKTYYKLVADSPETNCATLRVAGAGVGEGPFVPLMTLFYFQPESGRDQKQYDSSIGGSIDVLVGGDYYLNIAPNATDRDLHATLGSKDGTTPTPSASLCGAVPCLDRLLNGLPTDPEEIRRLGEEEARQRKARQEAEYAARFQADLAREKANTRSVADYSPDWMAKGLIVRGTVSRVGLEPMWAVVYFRESPNGDFVGCIPRRLFEGFAGKDFSGLIGKTVDVRGNVVLPLCGPKRAGMQIGTPSAIKGNSSRGCTS